MWTVFIHNQIKSPKKIRTLRYTQNNKKVNIFDIFMGLNWCEGQKFQKSDKL